MLWLVRSYWPIAVRGLGQNVKTLLGPSPGWTGIKRWLLQISALVAIATTLKILHHRAGACTGSSQLWSLADHGVDFKLYDEPLGVDACNGNNYSRTG